jgi:hypothetical protein
MCVHKGTKDTHRELSRIAGFRKSKSRAYEHESEKLSINQVMYLQVTYTSCSVYRVITSDERVVSPIHSVKHMHS